jgi:hypothetical protein
MRTPNSDDKSVCPVLLSLAVVLMLALIFGPGACDSGGGQGEPTIRTEGQP